MGDCWKLICRFGKFSYPILVELEKEKKLISSNELVGLELVIGIMVGVQTKCNAQASVSDRGRG